MSALIALWLALFALSGLEAAAAFLPGTWAWGFAALRFVAPGTGWPLWAVGALALAPILARGLTAVLARLGQWCVSWPVFGTLGWMAAAALLVWALPDRVRFTGDFLLRQGSIGQALPPTALSPQALPLDVLLHYHLPRFLIRLGSPDANHAARLIGAAEAAVLVAFATAFARALGLRGAAWFAAAAVAGFGGWLGLYTGYGKAFGELAMLTPAVAAFGIRASRAPVAATGRASGWGLAPLGLALALALAVHRLGLALLPGAALALALGIRTRGPAAWRSPGTIVAVTVPLVTLAALLPHIASTVVELDLTRHLAPAGGGWKAALSPLGLLDRLNLIGALSPLVLALPALRLAGARLPRGRDVAILGTLAAPPLLVLLLTQPQQGVFRDWDVYAPTAIALALLAAAAIGSALEALPAQAWLAAGVTLAAVVSATLWLLQDSDLERGLVRVTAFAAEPPERSESDRGQTWEFLATRYRGLGRADAEAEAMARAASLTPSVRVMMQWGVAEGERGNYLQARRAFEGAVARDPDRIVAWMHLLHVCTRLGDVEGGWRAAQQLHRLMPGNPRVEKVLADLERRRSQGERSRGARR